MQAVILAGGQGTRLGDLTKHAPKSMVSVRGRPFLEYQVELLRSAGITELVICVGHLREAIMSHFGGGGRFDVKISYSIEETPLGTGGALKNASPLLEDLFYLVYGDSYLLADLKRPLAYFRSRCEPALMMVYRNQDRLDRSNTSVKNGFVDRYSKTQRTPDMVYIDYGASIFRRGALEKIPPGMPFPLEALQARLAQEGKLLAYEVAERFYEIGNPAGLHEFEKYIAGVE